MINRCTAIFRPVIQLPAYELQLAVIQHILHRHVSRGVASDIRYRYSINYVIAGHNRFLIRCFFDIHISSCSILRQAVIVMAPYLRVIGRSACIGDASAFFHFSAIRQPGFLPDKHIVISDNIPFLFHIDFYPRTFFIRYFYRNRIPCQHGITTADAFFGIRIGQYFFVGIACAVCVCQNQLKISGNITLLKILAAALSRPEKNIKGYRSVNSFCCCLNNNIFRCITVQLIISLFHYCSIAVSACRRFFYRCFESNTVFSV